MLIEPTLHRLRQLKLSGMAAALEHQQTQPSAHSLSFDERLGFLVDSEYTYRENRRLATLLKVAKLRHLACVEDINYHHARGLARDRMLNLIGMDWLRQHYNLLLTGPTGIGKSWLACALGHQACRLGLSVRYFRLTPLLETLRIAQADGSYRRLLTQLAKVDLLILDDWGLNPLSQEERRDVLEVIEERHGLKSLLMTSQLPVAHWHASLGDATLADALLDRLLSRAHRLELQGASLRKMMPIIDKA